MAKVKGSKVSQGSRPGEVQKPETVTLKVTVSRDVAKLLKLESFGRDCSLGRVVEDLVKASPRRFVLMDRAKGTLGSEGQTPPPALASPSPRGEAGALGLHREDVA